MISNWNSLLPESKNIGGCAAHQTLANSNSLADQLYLGLNLSKTSLPIDFINWQPLLVSEWKKHRGTDDTLQMTKNSLTVTLVKHFSSNAHIFTQLGFFYPCTLKCAFENSFAKKSKLIELKFLLGECAFCMR